MLIDITINSINIPKIFLFTIYNKGTYLFTQKKFVKKSYR